MPTRPPRLNAGPADTRSGWQQRPSRFADKRLRGRAGQRARREQQDREPACRACAAEGKMVRAEEVDHIRPLSQGGTDGPSNKQSLCVDHHKSKTVRENGGTPRPRVRIGHDGWPTT